MGEVLEHVADGERHPIRSVTFCNLGERVLTRSERARGIWHAATGEKIDLFANRIGIQVARFSPSSRLVVGGTNYSTGQVWDHNGKDAVPIPLVHGAQVWGVAADPTDEMIITASFDRTARIWDRSTGR